MYSISIVNYFKCAIHLFQIITWEFLIFIASAICNVLDLLVILSVKLPFYFLSGCRNRVRKRSPAAAPA